MQNNQITTLKTEGYVTSHDMVEIEPVRLDAEGNPVPVFDETARASSTFKVKGKGDFDLKPNPAHVRGAYANLRHHQARGLLRNNKLDDAAGTTHLVPLERAELFAHNFDIETTGMDYLSSDGPGFAGQENFAMAGAMMAARTAALGTDATHLAIRIR